MLKNDGSVYLISENELAAIVSLGETEKLYCFKLELLEKPDRNEMILAIHSLYTKGFIDTEDARPELIGFAKTIMEMITGAASCIDVEFSGGRRSICYGCRDEILVLEHSAYEDDMLQVYIINNGEYDKWLNEKTDILQPTFRNEEEVNEFIFSDESIFKEKAKVEEGIHTFERIAEIKKVGGSEQKFTMFRGNFLNWYVGENGYVLADCEEIRRKCFGQEVMTDDTSTD